MAELHCYYCRHTLKRMPDVQTVRIRATVSRSPSGICPKCGGRITREEPRGERWICGACGTVVTFRLIRKSDPKDPSPDSALDSFVKQFENKIEETFRMEQFGWVCTNPECPGPSEGS